MDCKGIMMKNRFFMPYILIFIFIVFTFTSCNESDIGIFYGLETEEKLADNSLPNNVTVGSMTNNGGELYIAAGRVYTRTSGSAEDWDKLSSPSGYDLSTSLASDGSNVYAVFYDKDSAEKALFSMPNGGNWVKIDTSSVSGDIELVKSANNSIFVSTRINSQEGKLYYFSGVLPFIELADITMTGPVFHVIHHNSFYWISNYNILYKTAIDDPDSAYSAVDLSLNLNDEITGLSESSDSYIYYTYRDKNSVRSYVGATDGNTVDETGDDFFYVLNGIKLFNISGYEFLMVGTGGRGYYHILNPSSTRLDPDKPSNDALADNYTSAVDLMGAVVLDFFVDGGIDGDLYALTATSGLWKNSLSGGERVWSIE